MKRELDYKGLLWLFWINSCYGFISFADSEQTTDPAYTQHTDLVQTAQTGDDGTLTLILFWQVRYNLPCDAWPPFVFVTTVNHTFHPPNPFVPIAENDEYNVTVAKSPECSDTENTTEVNVTLSLLLNDNVLQHVPYIQCLISREAYGDIRSQVPVYLPLPTDQCQPTAGQTESHTDNNIITDDCVPFSASLRNLQVLHLYIILFLIANILCEL